MRAIVNTAPGRLEILELPLPMPGPSQVRVRTLACGICATDLRMISGWDRTGFPSIPGHEWCGVVDACGEGVEHELLGKLCVGENVLSDGGEVGFEHPGGYAQFFVTEAEKLYLLPEGFPPHVGALTEPLAVVVRATKKLPPGMPPDALVFGDGPIGLITLLLLRRGNLRVERVFVVGGSRKRLELARELGAAGTYDYRESRGALAADIEKVFARRFALIVEASGSSAALEAAMELASVGARILVLGDYGDSRASFKWNKLLHAELEILGSNASAGAWPEAMALALSGRLPLEKLISHRLPAENFEEAVRLARAGELAVKVVIEWPSSGL